MNWLSHVQFCAATLYINTAVMGGLNCIVVGSWLLPLYKPFHPNSHCYYFVVARRMILFYLTTHNN